MKYQYFSLFEVKLRRIKAGNISFERALKTASNDVFYLFSHVQFFWKKLLFFEKNFWVFPILFHRFNTNHEFYHGIL